MKKLSAVLLVIIFIQASSAHHRTSTSPAGLTYAMAFKDEFKGKSPDEKKWNYRTDSRHWSTQVPGNVTLGNGYLYLNVKKARSKGKDYTGSGIISKKAFGQGYYEARFKTPPGAGWHTSFWLMYANERGSTDASKTTLEYDICENDSKNKHGYSMTIHRWRGKHETFVSKYQKTPDLSADFHTWGCEILPDKVHYYFDGTLVQTINTASLPFEDINIWLTTIASSLGNTTAVDDTKLPSYAVFDYIRFYKRID